MKISLITVCYNSEATIEDTLKSVLVQNYDNYEHIIIDGGSTDSTLNIIKKYQKKYKDNLKYISESDKGLYDAMNKGIKMSIGDIIGILNSDDSLAHENVFTEIIDKFNYSNCDGIYSNLKFLDENMKSTVRIFNAKRKNYKLGWYPPHPTLYLKKEVYKKIGNYNINYRIAADYDLMLRLMTNNYKLEYINDYLVYMRSGGVSTDGFKGYVKSFKESLKVLKNNKIKFPFCVNTIRTFKIFIQMVIAKK